MTGADVLRYPRDDPAAFELVAARCARLVCWVDALTARLAQGDAAVGASWHGPAAVAYGMEVRQVASRTGPVPHAVHLAARLLRAHAARVAEARTEVDRLRAQYDGLVAAARREAAGPPDLPGPLGALRRQDATRELTEQLARIQARHRDVLLDLASDAVTAARQILAAAHDVLPQWPPAGTVPRRVHTWWAALTAAEQDRLVTTWPTRRGALDGLPAAARSRANELLLDRELTALRANDVRSASRQRWLANCLVVRDTLRHLRSRRDPFTREPMTAQLLVFEPARFGGDGRVAVGVGDSGTAEDVAVMVPGLGADVRSYLDALTGDAVRVQRAALGADPEAGRTAVVAWMGYDAPELWNVASDDPARRGGRLLAADLIALQAGRATPPHLTVIGESYGSTTAGAALRATSTGADDLVIVGSPGAGVEKARELRVPLGHVFVGANSRDPVSYLDYFGADPTHEGFGGHRFRAEDVTRNRWMLDLADHTKYFDPRTESLANVARVVVADYDAVERAEYRGEALLLPDGINTDPEADRVPTPAQ